MRFHRTAVITLAFWTACNLSSAAEDHPVVITLKTHIKPRSQGSVRYNYIPFHVAEGATRLDVWNNYDKAGGKNVVDLGGLRFACCGCYRSTAMDTSACLPWRVLPKIAVSISSA